MSQTVDKHGRTDSQDTALSVSGYGLPGQRYEHKYTISLLWSTIYLVTHSIKEILYSTYTLEVSSNHSLSYGLQHSFYGLCNLQQSHLKYIP